MAARKSSKKLIEGFEPTIDIDDFNTIADKTSDFKVLRIDQLTRHPENRDVDMGAVESLAESIREEGQGQAILVRPHGSGYQIVAGEHRWAAKRLLAERYPDEPAHRTIEAVVRDMSDAEAYAQLIATNLYMRGIPSEERGSMFIELGRRVPEMRAAEPEKYANVPTAQIVADMVSEVGPKVSKTTVNRDMAAARAKKELEGIEDDLIIGWQDEAAFEAVPKKTLVQIASLKQEDQDELLEGFRGCDGPKKSWLAEQLVYRDVDRAEAAMLKSLKSIIKEAGVLNRLRERYFYIDTDEVDSIIAMLERLKTPMEE